MPQEVPAMDAKGIPVVQNLTGGHEKIFTVPILSAKRHVAGSS